MADSKPFTSPSGWLLFLESHVSAPQIIPDNPGPGLSIPPLAVLSPLKGVMAPQSQPPASAPSLTQGNMHLEKWLMIM